MLRLDNSEMLPGSQKGEKTAEILKTHTRFTRKHTLLPVNPHNSLERVMITSTRAVIPRDVNRRASLAGGEQVSVTPTIQKHVVTTFIGNVVPTFIGNVVGTV